MPEDHPSLTCHFLPFSSFPSQVTSVSVRLRLVWLLPLSSALLGSLSTREERHNLLFVFIPLIYSTLWFHPHKLTYKEKVYMHKDFSFFGIVIGSHLGVLKHAMLGIEPAWQAIANSFYPLPTPCLDPRVHGEVSSMARSLGLLQSFLFWVFLPNAFSNLL